MSDKARKSQTELFVVEREDGEWIDDKGDGGWSGYTSIAEAQDALDNEIFFPPGCLKEGAPEYKIVRFVRVAAESQRASLNPQAILVIAGRIDQLYTALRGGEVMERSKVAAVIHAGYQDAVSGRITNYLEDDLLPVRTQAPSEQSVIDLIQRPGRLAVKCADAFTLPSDEFEKKYYPFAGPGAFRDEATAIVQELSKLKAGTQAQAAQPDLEARCNEAARHIFQDFHPSIHALDIPRASEIIQKEITLEGKETNG